MKEGDYLVLKKSIFKFLTLVLMALILVSTTTYYICEFNKINQVKKERQAVSDKVTIIMQLYHCNNREIHESIMKTFDPVLIAIVIGVESEYRINAVSSAGCRGLMQLSPDKLEDWRNVDKNIRTGSEYLAEQLDRFGSLELAIAAYNAGPGSVSKYKGVPPYSETKEYVKKAKLLSLAFDHFLPWTTERIRHLL
jgi:soluble lytic murein transglycosylase-like protein